MLLPMAAKRHGQARHGLHGQQERGEDQQEASETMIHDAKITSRSLAVQAGALSNVV
jgi:hypothetical protein